MRELIPTIEEALGPERLERLKKDEDAMQQFWLGVLEATARADLSRDVIGFYISNGYGAIRNMRKSEDSMMRRRVCPGCGAIYGNRTKICRRCGAELWSVPVVFPLTMPDGTDRELEAPRPWAGPVDLQVDIESFVCTLGGRQAYVARRWLLDRADLFYDNHLAQIALEMGVSKPRVAQLKKRVREAFRVWYLGL